MSDRAREKGPIEPCQMLLYDFREGLRRDYGDEAARRFAEHNGIPVHGGGCPCPRCAAGDRETSRAFVGISDPMLATVADPAPYYALPLGLVARRDGSVAYSPSSLADDSPGVVLTPLSPPTTDE